MCLAIPGRVVRLLEDEVRQAVVDFAGLRKKICLEFTPEAKVNDFVLCHAGFSISKVDEDRAQQVLEELSVKPETDPSGPAEGEEK